MNNFCKLAVVAVAAMTMTMTSYTAAQAADSFRPVTAVLPDGIRLIVQDDPSSQLVAVTVLVKAGQAEETVGDAGIGSMVADAILTGTSNENADTIATSIGDVGGNVKAVWQPDLTQIRALVLPAQFQDTAYLLADVLKNADFSQDSVEEARQDLLARIQERSDDVFDSTDDALRASLYSGTPYALPQIGTVDTIKRLTPADLQRYFVRYYRPNNITISVVGNIDPSTVESVFGQDLQDFVRPSFRHPEDPIVAQPMAGNQPLVIKRYRGDVTAGLMLMGYIAPGVGSSDYPAMLIANALLGGMKTSLMFKNLRTKNAYGYEVASTYTAQVGASDVTGYILYPLTANGVENKKVDQTSVVKEAMLAQFKAMTEAPPTDADLTRAKKYVIGSTILAHERIEDRSYYLGYADFSFKQIGGYKYDENYANDINAVTADDVLRVSKKYFAGAPVISLLLPGDPNTGVISE